MSDDSRADREAPKDAPAAPKKRPYERPRIVSREPLVAVATVCNAPGKTDPFACPSGPIQS